MPLQALNATLWVLFIPTVLYGLSLTWVTVPPTLKGGIREIQFFTGALSYALAAILIITAARPKWLERFILLDKYYLFHKLVGLSAVILVGVHFFAKDVGRLILPYIMDLQATSGVKRAGAASGMSLRQLAEVSGLYLTYLATVLIVLTFIKALPYRYWQKTHRLFPLIFLALIFHAVVLTEKSQYLNLLTWWYLALMLIALPYALKEIAGRSGSTQNKLALVQAKQRGKYYLKLQLKVPPQLAIPGKFILLKLPHGIETAHPYTIATAKGDLITLYIRASGHFASRLQNLSVGDSVYVEGPYGKSALSLPTTAAANILWVCQGSGLAQLPSALDKLSQAHAQGKLQGKVQILALVKAREDDILQDLQPTLIKVSAFPTDNCQLHLWCSHDKGRLDLAQAQELCAKGHFTHVCICGSSTVKTMLAQAFVQSGGDKRKVQAEYTAWRSLCSKF